MTVAAVADTTWKPGLRLHPAIRRLLGSAAELEGLSVEVKLHKILCRELDQPALADETPVSAGGKKRPRS